MIAMEKKRTGDVPKIRLYRDDRGELKGDAVLTFEDPNAALKAPDFFNDALLCGNKIKVELASSKSF